MKRAIGLATLLLVATPTVAKPPQALFLPPSEHPDPTPATDIEMIGVQDLMKLTDHKQVSAGSMQDYCWKYKCLLVANKSNFEVTRLLVSTSRDAQGQRLWEEPVMASKRELRIAPRQAQWWYRNETRKNVCRFTVRVQAYNRSTNEQIDNIKDYDFCNGGSIVTVLLTDPDAPLLRGAVLRLPSGSSEAKGD